MVTHAWRRPSRTAHTYHVTDHMTGQEHEADDLESFLSLLFPAAPSDVQDAVDGLIRADARHEPTSEYEAYLGITVERHYA